MNNNVNNNANNNVNNQINNNQPMPTNQNINPQPMNQQPQYPNQAPQYNVQQPQSNRMPNQMAQPNPNPRIQAVPPQYYNNTQVNNMNQQPIVQNPNNNNNNSRPINNNLPNYNPIIQPRPQQTPPQAVQGTNSGMINNQTVVNNQQGINPINQTPMSMPQHQANIQGGTIIQPQTAAPVNPVEQIVPQDINLNSNLNNKQSITPSIIESNNNDVTSTIPNINDASDVTFDYNSLYGISEDKNNDNFKEENNNPMFTAQDIVIENHDLQGRKIDDIVPEFNINALDANTSESDSKLTDNVLNGKQQDKADTQKKIIFILVLVALLVISVGFIFPIISGYKF